MKKYAILPFLVALLFRCGHVAAQSESMIYVEGEVCNIVEHIPLPFCEVQFTSNDAVVASARCDEAGRYVMPSMPSGDFTLVITQFSDTLLLVKSVRLERDSRLVCRVVLPDASQGEMWLPSDIKQINLGEVRIVVAHNMLAKMGLLITSPHDKRLWNFSGEMNSNDRSAAVADPSSCNKYLNSNRGLTFHPDNSVMKNELILFGRILDEYTPPPADTAGKKD